MGCPSRSLLASAVVLSLVFLVEAAIPDDKKNKVDHQEYKNKLFSVTLEKTKSKGQCEQEIAIKSSGVDDTFTEECIDNLEVLSTDDFIVIGNPVTNPYSLLCFSDTDNIVVTISEGKCTVKLYHTTDDGKLAGISSNIEAEVCEDLKKKIDKKMIAKKKAENGKVDDDQDIVGSEKGDRKFEVTTNSYDKRGKCIQEIAITGNGVEYTFRGPCISGLEVVNTNDILIVGDPEKTPFTLFSNSPATLVVLKGGECTKRTYVSANGKAVQQSAEVLDTEECDKIEAVIKKELAKDKKTKEGNKEEGEDDSEFIVSKESFDRRGKCIQEIKIKGNGVDDVFRSPCVENLGTVKRKNLLIIGDLDKTPFCLFSDKRGVIVVIKGGQCTKRTYSTVNGKTSSTSADLDSDQCDEVQDKVKKQLNVKEEQKDDKSGEKYEVSTVSFERRGRCIQEIKINGKGVQDIFRGPCVENLGVVSTNDVLIIGEPQKTPFCIFSDSPSTLVVFKDDQCTKKSYSIVNGKTSSTSSTLDFDECDEVETKIKKEIEKNRKAEKDKQNKGDCAQFTIKNESWDRRGKCFTKITVEGNGVKDSFTGSCDDKVEVISSKCVLVVGDPDKSPFSLLSDKPDTLVVLKDGLCRRRTYTTDNGKVSSTSTVLEDSECDEVEEKIKSEIKKKKQTHEDASKKEESPFVVNSETFDRRGKCVKKVTVEGNGVKDSFTVTCEDEVEVIKNTKDELIVGDPDKSPLSLYSDKASTLVVVKEGLCRQRSYTIANGKATSSSTLLDDSECDDIEEKIQARLKEKMTSDKGGNNENAKYAEVTTDTVKRNNRCTQVIKIKGKGIEDTFKGPCVNNLETVNTKDVLIIGDLDNTPFCLFSDKPGTLVVVKDGECKLKSYAKGAPSTTVLGDDKCDEVESKVEKELKKKGTNNNKNNNNRGTKLYDVTIDMNRDNGKCSKVITIKGNGVEDVFRALCPDKIDMSNENENILRVGDPFVKPFFCLYSDEPSTLVKIKDEECKKRHYKTVNGRTTLKNELLMDEEECEEIIGTIGDMMGKKGKGGGGGGGGGGW